MSTPGERIKHYEIIKSIGKGGMGEVFLANDTILDRKVAIKFLPPDMQKDPKARSRFIREAKSAAALDHPFICKIYETGEVEGKTYIVMEFIEGETLGDKLKEGPLSIKETIRIVLEIVDALEKAHSKRIVHRDLKPANIMLTPSGHVKVMDFGLAKEVFPESDTETRTLRAETITEHGLIVGTLAYMSPEQARGESVDARSDIFSLGVIFYEMFSGENFFSHPSAVETLSSILRDTPPTAELKPKNINPHLNPVIRKALAKDPEKRYQSITEFAAAIKKVQQELFVEKRLHFPKIPVIIASASIIVIVLLSIWLFVLRGKVSIPEVQKERISVLLADFGNSTGDPDFDGALEPILGISLEGAPFISIYERGKARQLANQLDPSADSQLNSKLAQLISTREGINVVIDASIEPSGEGYVIKAWSLDPSTSEKIAEFSRKIKTKAEVGKAADYLSAKLRSSLGDTPTKSAQAFAKETFTASSLVAMQSFARGQELFYLGKREEAIKYLLKAVDNDPNLGRAYVTLGTIYNNLKQHEEAERYFQMAFARIDQMTEREKHRTSGSYYLIKKNYPQAIEEYKALIEKFPYDSVGNLNLELAYFYARDMAKAAEFGRRSVELNPKDNISRYNLVWYIMGAGDFETAVQEVYTLLKIEPNYYEAYVCRALSELAQGQTTQATETYQQLKLKSLKPYPASQASTGLADIAAYEGRLADTITILKKEIDFDLKNNQNFIAADKYTFLAQTYMLQGGKNLALEAADSAAATSKAGEILFSAAEIFVQAGEDDKARNFASELSKKLQPSHRAYAKLIGGELSMARGEFPGAIQLFQEAQAIVDTWLGHFLLGCTYLKAKAFSEAYSEFEKCLKRQGEATSVFFNDLPTYRYVAPVYYYLGRAQEGLKSPKASDSYQAFLIIKEKADGDWMVEDARKRLSNL